MILHVDMDAFYASVEERENPSLKGLPIVVGGSPQGRGVVSAANYVARRYGVRSAMPTATAIRLCPLLKIVPSRMKLYASVSTQIQAIFRRYTPLVETLSLDEAFLDVTGSRRLFGSPQSIGRRIKADIASELALVASVGVAPSKFVAKIASDLEKPDGFVHVDAASVSEFLAPLPIRRLWGVGKATAAVLDSFGIETFADVRAHEAQWLTERLGANGRRLWELAHGIDERKVVPSRRAKSISHETTFAADLRDLRALLSALHELAEQVSWRLRNSRLQARTVFVKVRYADFKTVNRAVTLDARTDVSKTIWQAAKTIAHAPLERREQGIRLLGVGVSGFTDDTETAPKQEALFAEPVAAPEREVDKVMDDIRGRFGARAVRRGAGPSRQ
ncbi:MAG: DNA polymerase IV [Gammaproteobacteria bacterium]|nr:DNA polymerase IV [Gammaproteobacteria bacterium]